MKHLFGRYVYCRLFVFLFCFSPALSVVAASEAVVNRDVLVQLSASPRWLNIMHYQAEPQWVGEGVRWRSSVKEPRYFYAEEGGQDPMLELEATLRAFLQRPEVTHGVDDPSNLHPQCQFPARFELVKALLITQQMPLAFPRVECPVYQQWREKVNAKKATLVFASSYLNSPSSMFGHTFLRLDASDVDVKSTWLSYALNFGAVVEEEDNSILYAYKGIVGGYNGYFALMPYYEKIKEYNKMENRSLWEYPLVLTEAEVSFLLAHIWELREVAFSYFFFDENCSYRLLELIEVAKPGVELTDTFRVHAIPIDTVRMLEENHLLGRSIYRPSSSDKLMVNAKRLTDSELEQVIALARGDLSVTSNQSLHVLNVAYQYLQFTQAKKARDTVLANRRLALLRAINAQTASQSDGGSIDPPRPISPEDSHASEMVAVRGGAFDGESYLDIEFRASYHDLLDPIDGYMKGGSINMGRVVVRQYRHNHMVLDTLDIVDINSLSPQTALYRPTTWRVNAGVDRVLTLDDDPLAIQLNGGMGVSLEPATEWLAYGLVEGRIEHQLEGADVGAGGGVRFGIIQYQDIGAASVSLSAMAFGAGEVRNGLSVAYNLNIAKNSSIRFRFQRDDLHVPGGHRVTRDVAIGYRYHY